MAKMEVIPVLAVARRRLQVRNDCEMQEFPLKNDKGEPAIDPATGKVRTEVLPVWLPVYCEPGTIINISEWTNAGAYENRGEIQILGPVEAKQAWAMMQEEAAEEAKIAAEAQAIAEAEAEAAEAALRPVTHKQVPASRSHKKKATPAVAVGEPTTQFELNELIAGRRVLSDAK